MSVIDSLKKEFERAEMKSAENAGGAEEGSDLADRGEVVSGNKLVIPADVVSLQHKKRELSGEEAALARFEDHFVSVEGGQTYIYRETTDPELGERSLQWQTVKSFHDIYAGETVMTSRGAQSVSRIWFNSAKRRTYPEGMKLLPGQEAPPGVYNLWSGFGFEPDTSATLSSVRKALWHLKYVICDGDKDAYSYLLYWLASAVQYPERQAEVAIVMIGGRGTGKGVVGGWFRSIFGSHGMHIQSADHLTGKFNGHLKAAVGLFVDEAFFVGDRQGNNKLKSLITEDRSMLEAKYMSASATRNRLKIMMATNEDHAIAAGSDERRYFVTRVSDRKKQDHAYFRDLTNWWDAKGNRAFLALLQRLNLTDFNIRKVPQTRALFDQKLQSLSGLDAWMYDLLQGGEVRWEKGREKATVDFAAQFKWYCGDSGGRYRYENTSPEAVSKGLRRWLNVERRRESSGSRRWMLVLPDLDKARRQFAEKLKVQIDWDE